LIAPYSQPCCTNVSIADKQNCSSEEVIVCKKRFKLGEDDALDKDLHAPIIPDEFEKSTSQPFFSISGTTSFAQGSWS